MDFTAINKLSLLDYPNHVSCILYTNVCNFRCPYCHNGLTLLEDHESHISFEEVLDFLKKRQGLLDGVVISGGEPTLIDDLEEKIVAIKALGYDVKIDTNGTNPDLIKHLIDEGLIDYVAMDIKGSLNKYSDIANRPVNVDSILRSIQILKENRIDYEFRTTLIDEFHNELDMISIGKMLEGAEVIYLQKYMVSDGVINKNLHPVSEDSVNKFAEILKGYVKEVIIRGY